MPVRAPASPLDAVTSALVATFAPRRIILFGSRARGDSTAGSDYDLAVEVEGDGDVSRMRRVIDDAISGRRVGVDLYVCRAGELERRADDPGWLDYAIVREGTVLYAAPGVARSLRRPARTSEPPPDGWPSVAAWLERAHRDLLLIEHEIVTADPLWDIVAFHAQQAAEKSLKALLVHANHRPPRTHVLMELVAALESAGVPTSALLEDCRRLEPYSVDIRYPTLTPMPTRAEGRALVDAARRVVDAVARLTVAAS